MKVDMKTLKENKIVNKVAVGLAMTAFALFVLLTFTWKGGLFLIFVFAGRSIQETFGRLNESELDEKTIRLWGRIAFTSIVVIMGFNALMTIKFGHLWLLFIAFNNYATDTGAYIFGTYAKSRGWTTRPLAPETSPNKTWEGAIAGVLFSLALCLILQIWLIDPRVIKVGIPTLSLLLITGSCLNIIGDLVGSWFKREVKIEDSDKVFGEHGGFLDKADGFLFCSLGYILFFVIITLIKANLPVDLSIF